MTKFVNVPGLLSGKTRDGLSCQDCMTTASGEMPFAPSNSLKRCAASSTQIRSDAIAKSADAIEERGDTHESIVPPGKVSARSTKRIPARVQSAPPAPGERYISRGCDQMGVVQRFR
jgi:hypothetical protein